MKRLQGDEGKQGHTKGVALIAEAEPLFPRVHVSQTEKAGPRAPPRNKMALFEQFTVPYHGFVPPSGMTQVQYKGYPIPSLDASCMFPHTNVGVGVLKQDHPYHDTGSGSTVHDQDNITPEQSAKVCRDTSQMKRAQKQVTVRAVNGHSRASQSAHKDAMDHIMSFHGMPKKAIKMSLVNPMSQHLGNSAGDWQASPEPLKASKSDELLDCPTVQDRSVPPVVVNTEDTDRITHFIGKQNGQGCEPLTLLQGHYGLQHSTSKDKQLSEHEQISMHSNSHPVQLNIIGLSKDVDQSSKGFERSFCHTDALNVEVILRDGRQNAGIDNLSITPQCNGNIGGHEEQHQYGLGNKSNGSLHEVVVSAHPFRPKDIILSVGQQNFWNARKLMLRQQRILSDQVFELHRLIKVQQLLAGSSGVLVEEQACEELAGLAVNDAKDKKDSIVPSTKQMLQDHARDNEEGLIPSPKQMIQDHARGNEEKLVPSPKQMLQVHARDKEEVRVPSSKQMLQAHALELDSDLAYPSNESWHQPPSMGPIAQHKPAYQLALPHHTVGASAWGYPCLGFEHWMHSAARHCTYPPYSRPGIQVCIPTMMPQMMSFGFPVYQRQEMKTDAQGCRPFSDCQEHSGICHGLATGLVHADSDMQSSVITADVDGCPLTGSIASVNKQKSSGDEGKGLSPRSGINATVSRSSKKSSQDSMEVSVYNHASHGSRLHANKPRKTSVLLDQGDREGSNIHKHSVSAFSLFPRVPSVRGDVSCSKNEGGIQAGEWHGKVIKVTPKPAIDTQESAAEILLSLQQERQQ